jgi:uncharacterized protein (TIGR02265 family)
MLSLAQESVVFKGTLEALFLRAHHGRLDAQVVDALKAVGLDLGRELLPAYPYDVFEESLRLTLEALYGPSPTVDDYREFGRVWTDAFFQTFTGTALLEVLKIIGPRRALLRSAQNYRNVNTYADARVVELGPAHFEVFLADRYPWPHVSAGSLQRSVELCGAREVVARHVRRDGTHNVYDVTWTP